MLAPLDAHRSHVQAHGIYSGYYRSKACRLVQSSELMDQVFQSWINRGLDRFSPLSSADWTGPLQTVQADLQTAPVREEHCESLLFQYGRLLPGIPDDQTFQTLSNKPTGLSSEMMQDNGLSFHLQSSRVRLSLPSPWSFRNSAVNKAEWCPRYVRW
jgi:hypothetical protein